MFLMKYSSVTSLVVINCYLALEVTIIYASKLYIYYFSDL